MSTSTTPAAAKGGRRLYLWTSIAAWFMNFFIIPAFHYPMGPKSHYGPEGTILAVVAGIAGAYGFFGCPRRPILLKLGTALICIFSAAIAMYAVIQFIRFERST
jgi:hypothetical protein